MMRIVLLITNLERGGAEIQVVQLARALRERGWDITVVSLLMPAATEITLELDDVPVEFLDAGRSAWRVARLSALLNRIRPQVVHAHLFHANIAARLIRLVCPVPVVVSTIHSMAESSRRSANIRARDWLYRLTDRLADRVVCVSQAVAERHICARAARSSHTSVIPNGVDTNRFHSDAARGERTRRALGLDGEFTWLSAGRLMWKKNYPLLLEAAARLPECALLVAGEGPEEARLKELAAKLGVRARFLGPRSDMPDLMNACDGFVLSSAVEGLPMVLIEAAASGLPQVATAVGGVADVVADGKTGYLVPPDDCGALAQAMSRLMAMPARERAEMSAAAREHALTRFDQHAVAAAWDRLYKDLLLAERRANREI